MLSMLAGLEKTSGSDSESHASKAALGKIAEADETLAHEVTPT
jgi:hypothetical protein